LIALPIRLRWNGAAFEPAGARVAKECSASYVVGEVYDFVEHKPRSHKSHAHFFACINEAFDNLPEACAGQFATPEHLRKWALIQGGYRKERMIVCRSLEDAERMAGFIRPLDEYAIITTDGPIIRIWTAASQREDGAAAMDAKEFQASKQAVLDVIAEMIGVAPAELSRHGGTSA
jgi:hypothetical protein